MFLRFCMNYTRILHSNTVISKIEKIKNRRFEDFVCYTVILVVLPYYIPVVCTSRYTSSREEEYIRSPLFLHILQLYTRLMGGKYTQ